MSAAGEFVDATLQNEGDWFRAAEAKSRLESELRFYGASVGAIRGTMRDMARRYPGLTHDEITSLSSELWAEPVFELRLAAIVLLQSNVRLLRNSDLTRLEGFLRDSGVSALADPLAVDVIRPLLVGLTGTARQQADVIIERWSQEDNLSLRRAAQIVLDGA
ncbi:DNA alkylation repair protein [Leifsonia sp. A12D58]|uniref:DNA alkylation repair protein n=1 Tax=Leifsonia sp. A12D58 TaxID=3397674 RepID=UPI0039E143BB